MLKLLLVFVVRGWILTYLSQSRLTFLGLLGHGYQTPTMVTSKMILLTGVDCSETQAVDPVSSAWRDSLLYVFSFIVKTDTQCSVNL